MTDNNKLALDKLTSLGAEVLAGIILDSITAAGALSEWDSETVEAVLEPYEPLLKQVDLPWIGDTGFNDEGWKFWASVADARGIYTDYEPESDFDEDDDQ